MDTHTTSRPPRGPGPKPANRVDGEKSAKGEAGAKSGIVEAPTRPGHPAAAAPPTHSSSRTPVTVAALTALVLALHVGALAWWWPSQPDAVAGAATRATTRTATQTPTHATPTLTSFTPFTANTERPPATQVAAVTVAAVPPALTGSDSAAIATATATATANNHYQKSENTSELKTQLSLYSKELPAINKTLKITNASAEQPIPPPPAQRPAIPSPTPATAVPAAVAAATAAPAAAENEAGRDTPTGASTGTAVADTATVKTAATTTTTAPTEVAMAVATATASTPSGRARPDTTTTVITPTAPAPAGTRPGAPPSSGPLRVPASATLTYEVTASRKGLSLPATSTLAWHTDGSTYRASLLIEAPLARNRSQTSVGDMDPQLGLQPRRFGDKNRAEVATHFDRTRTPPAIRFSANAPDAPLLPQSQDRLSVLFQLAALVAGDPKRFVPGQRALIHTAGSRDAEDWAFRTAESGPLTLPVGTLDTVHLVREPQSAHDNRVDVWLAPALGHLPVRILWTQSNGDVVDQRLRTHSP